MLEDEESVYTICIYSILYGGVFGNLFTTW